MQRVVRGTSASCTQAVTRPCARTCSSSKSVPPGLSTRQISRRPRSGSCTEQKTSVAIAVSKCASGNGRASTGAHLQHEPFCLPDDLAPQGIEHPPDQRLPHHPVVKRGKTRVGDLLHPSRSACLVLHRLAPLAFLTGLVMG